MATNLPQFAAPPVVEVALGVQFASLSGFTTAHAGRFWSTLGSEWNRVEEVQTLDDAFERFGDERVWGRPGLRFMPGTHPNRIQIINKEDDHMLQVQPSRFVLNWRRRDENYPRFKAVFPKFLESLERFKTYCDDADVGPLSLNQWEVVYVNNIPRNDLWQTAGDWPSILPCASFPKFELKNHEPEALAAHWQFVLREERGRLHVDLNLVKDSSKPVDELLQLKLVARGPIAEENGFDLHSSFHLGHEAIVLSFDCMTSPRAHKYWQKIEE